MPQPIDINTELGRIAAVERIAQVADRASLAAQARVTDETVEQRQHAESEVGETEQKDQEVDSEGRRREPYSGRRHRQEAEEEAARRHAHPDAGDLPVIPDEDHGLDISV